MKKRILLSFSMHFDYPGIGPDDQGGKRTSQAIKITTEILEKYRLKAQYGVTGLVIQNLERDFPEVVEKIRMMKMPISYHGDHIHVPNPIRFDKLKGLAWLDRMKKIWRYETHKLNTATGEVYPDQIGGYLAIQKILRVTPLPTDVAGRGERVLHESVLIKMGAGSYPFKPVFPENTVNYLHTVEPNLFPDMTQTAGGFLRPQYMGKEPGAEAPKTADPIEWFKWLARNMPRDPPGGVAFIWHSQPVDPYVAKNVDNFLNFVTDNPEDFKVVWPDLDSNQYREEYSPSTFYKETYGIQDLNELVNMELPPKNRDKVLSMDKLLRASDHILSLLPYSSHWGNTGGPPDYVDIGTECLSLNDVFQAIAYSLAQYRKQKTLPKTITARDIYGPIDTPMYRDDEKPSPELVQSQGLPACGDYAVYYPVHVMADGEDMLSSIADVANKITDRIPSVIKVKMDAESSRGGKPRKTEVCVNPAEFLYAMAQEFRAVYVSKSVNPVLFVTMKVIEAQPGGVDVPGYKRGDVIPLRRWVDPALINSIWTYVPPKGIPRPRVRMFKADPRVEAGKSDNPYGGG